MAGQRRPSVEIWLNVRTPYHPKKTLDNLHTLTSFPLSTHWSLSLRYENESGKQNSGVHQHTHLQLLQRDKHFKISSAFSLYNIFLSCGTVVSSKYCSQTQYFNQREFTVLFGVCVCFFISALMFLNIFPHQAIVFWFSPTRLGLSHMIPFYYKMQQSRALSFSQGHYAER